MTYRPSPMMRLCLEWLPRIRYGQVTLVLPDGKRRHFEGPEPGPHGELHVHNDRIARRFILGGSLGFCEAYLDGDWTSPAPDAFMEVILKNEAAVTEYFYGRPWVKTVARLGHWLRPNSRAGAKRNIAAHYDLGNAFFAKWLDPSMTYSSAIFPPEADVDLETAQRLKYAELARRLDVRPGQTVLEIGCGWGGFAEYLAREHGAHVTGITISQAQHDYAAQRIAHAGLSDKVKIRLTDYRDVKGQFDRVASIEMFEAVGEAYWPVYFRTIFDRLKAGGRAALQIITIEEASFEHYRRRPDFIQKYIFPGGMLPSITALKDQVQQAGLKWEGLGHYAQSYARTLKEWDKRFQQAWPAIAPLGFDTRFKRMWEHYLHYCTAGFSAGTIDVVQLELARD